MYVAVAKAGPYIQKWFKTKPVESSYRGELKTLESFLSDLNELDRTALLTELEVKVYGMRQDKESKAILDVSQLAPEAQTAITGIENVIAPIILNPQLLNDEKFLDSIAKFDISDKDVLEEVLAYLLHHVGWQLEIRGDIPPAGVRINKDLHEYSDYKKRNGSILRIANAVS